MSDTKDEGFIETVDAVSILRKDGQTIRGLARAKLLPAYRSGRKWLFKRSELEAWLQRGQYGKAVKQ